MKLSACIPSSTEQSQSCLTVLLRLVLDVHISSQVRLIVATDLELNHLPHILKFGEHILIELQELLVGLLITVLQTGICVIVIPPALLHAKRDEHPSHEQRLARCGVVMLARTPVSKSAGTCFNIKWAICSILLCSQILWGLWVMPTHTIFQLAFSLIQHPLHSCLSLSLLLLLLLCHFSLFSLLLFPFFFDLPLFFLLTLSCSLFFFFL